MLHQQKSSEIAVFEPIDAVTFIYRQTSWKGAVLTCHVGKVELLFFEAAIIAISEAQISFCICFS